MASPSSNVPKPGRTLLGFFAVLGILTVIMLLQGQITPKLGLDLAGGTTVTLTAKTEAGKTPPTAQMDQAVKIINQRVNGLGVADAEVSKQGTNNIIVSIGGAGQQQVVDTIGKTAKLQFRQVYASGASTPNGQPLPSGTPTASTSGSPSPSASPSGSPKAGVKPSDTSTPRGRAVSGALAAPTPTPSGSGKPSPSATPSGQPTTTPTVPPDPNAAGQDFSGIDDQAVIKQYQSLVCSPNGGPTVPGSNNPALKWVAACDQKAENGQVTKYILGPVRVEGTQVSGANALPPDPQNGRQSWSVSLKFKGQGTKQFGDVTSDAYKAYQANPSAPQAQVAIILDGQVVSAPQIREGAITGGTASIDGPADSFTQSYADNLANVLKFGALPLEFQQSSIDEVSSTLGADQLHGGLIAGAIGLGLVVIYCLLYYQGLGLVAVGSLVVAGATTYLSVVILGEGMGFRLTLPHIIGLIVSIGITADSFIVYFERLRDELRAGRTLRPSVENAWKRARRTILVADAVTFIAALVLYFLAVGGVRGFAFAMGLTTLIDVVVVFFFTKPLVALLSRTEFFGRGHKFSGLDRNRLRRSGPTPPAARTKSQEA
ncbi:protein translocase subunit SecD [Actinomadura barringtoniae]|nr:protein translocase subunit SecD [Actinomadura barringtoniae]